MSATSWEDTERNERRPLPRLLDGISTALGSGIFVRSHRFPNLHLPTPGRSPRLPVSRYYYDLDPPVAIDFRREIRYGQEEMEAKKAYCARLDIRYVVVTDEYDGEALITSEPDTEAPNQQRPVISRRDGVAR